MIFLFAFIGVAFAVFLVCVINFDLKLQEAAGVTALFLTIIKTAYDEWVKRNQFQERVQATLEMIFSRKAVGHRPLGQGGHKDCIVITVTVFNPCEFEIPIKSVELRFVQSGLPDEMKRAPVEFSQCGWQFHVPPTDSTATTLSSALLAKRHSVNFVLEEPVEKMREHVRTAAAETLWIAVYSHGGEVARIDGKRILEKLAPLLK